MDLQGSVHLLAQVAMGPLYIPLVSRLLLVVARTVVVGLIVVVAVVVLATVAVMAALATPPALAGHDRACVGVTGVTVVVGFVALLTEEVSLLGLFLVVVDRSGPRLIVLVLLFPIVVVGTVVGVVVGVVVGIVIATPGVVGSVTPSTGTS